MNLKKVLSADVIAMEIKADSKTDIIKELISILGKAGKIKDEESVLTAVLKREAQMSTGIQSGVAIPHGKCSEIEELVACIGIAKEGKEFQALDGQSSNIFVLTISPAHKTGPHVQFLAEISRLLTREEIRDEILSAKTQDDILKAFLK